MDNNIVNGEVLTDPVGLTPSLTARPKEEKTMSFPEAIIKVIEGEMITKLEWNDMDAYGVLKDGRLKIVLKGKEFDWILSDGDLMGLDYVTRKEPN